MEPLLISVDVETAGPAPGRYALLEIGACVMERPAETFAVQLIPDRDGQIPEALAVSGLSLATLRLDGVEPGAAMASFARWIEAVAGERRPLMAGLNVAFDWMFVAEYFDRYLGENPFGHSALDIKSLAMGVDDVRWAETSWAALSARHAGGASLAHSAVQDAVDQAGVLRSLLLQHGTRQAGD